MRAPAGLSAGERADRVAAGAPHSWRLDVAAALRRTGKLSFAEQGRGRLACDPAAHGDVVLGRRDAPCSYHFCVTHDDAVQGVTLVTRGEDLLAATSIHRVLQAVMGWPEPEYCHLPLVTGPDGTRLSKRGGAGSLRAALPLLLPLPTGEGRGEGPADGTVPVGPSPNPLP